MTEIEKLNQAVDEFAAAMKARLAEKEKEGYTGWDGEHSESDLCDQIMTDADDILSGTADEDTTVAVDIANPAMMIFWRRKHS